MTVGLERPPGVEQTRARYPDEAAYVERDGVRVFYEVYGEGEPTVFLLPTWSIVHSRHWKMQIPYLARHRRVLTSDGRGNGRSGTWTQWRTVSGSTAVVLPQAVSLVQVRLTLLGVPGGASPTVRSVTVKAADEPTVSRLTPLATRTRTRPTPASPRVVPV